MILRYLVNPDGRRQKATRAVILMRVFVAGDVKIYCVFSLLLVRVFALSFAFVSSFLSERPFSLLPEEFLLLELLSLQISSLCCRYKLESASDRTHPAAINLELSNLFQALGAYFRPYTALNNSHISPADPVHKLFSCFMSTFSSTGSCKNAVSIWGILRYNCVLSTDRPGTQY